jgi:hypothetical protein
MAIDGKYGRVTLEKGTIGEDEPVVVFRSQDLLLPQVLEHYQELCREHGSPEKHLDPISTTIQTVRAWQDEHPTQVPRSDT